MDRSGKSDVCGFFFKVKCSEGIDALKAWCNPNNDAPQLKYKAETANNEYKVDSSKSHQVDDNDFGLGEELKE